MCGIVGLLVKRPELRANLGQLMVPMLVAMTERGSDSAGLALFGEPLPAQHRRLSIYCAASDFDWSALESEARARFDILDFQLRANHAALLTSADPVDVRGWFDTEHPEVHVLSVGRAIDLYKDTGPPTEIASRYDFQHLSGTHMVGHTRMATESAVTPENAHPYTAGEDWCLVHNGSLANPHSLKRMLTSKGIRFESDCDTEAACRYLSWRLSSAETLETALQNAFQDFDGFYTFLMGTHDKLALVRDPFACKPAIVAETQDYVAIASEFRALAHLPDIQSAHVFEPKPAEIYTWSV